MENTKNKPDNTGNEPQVNSYKRLADIPSDETQEVPGVGKCYKLPHIAEVFGVDRRTISKMLADKTLSGLKFGGNTWITLRSLQTAFNGENERLEQ